MSITAAQIKKFCPSAIPGIVNAIVSNWAVAEAAGIITDLRIQHFMVQIATETGGLRILEENLNYTTAQRVYDIFKGPAKSPRFKSVNDAKPYVRNPKALAIIAYGGRMGNAKGPSTDGWDFRGSGMMQTTGRDGYAALGYESNPDALREPNLAFKTAVQEWVRYGCNKYADIDNVTQVRKLINGGSNGLDEAKAYLAKAKKIFVNTSSVAPTAPIVLSTQATATPATTQKQVINQVQTLLRDKGYPEVGTPDGLFGTRTRNAILAFQADNHLDLTGQVTDDLLAQLVKAPVRAQSEARATATKADLSDKSTVKTGGILQKTGAATIAASFLGGGVKSVTSIDDVNAKLTSAKALYETVSSFAPWILGVAIGGVALYFGSHLIQRYVQAYREGRAL